MLCAYTLMSGRNLTINELMLEKTNEFLLQLDCSCFIVNMGALITKDMSNFIIAAGGQVWVRWSLAAVMD